MDDLISRQDAIDAIKNADVIVFYDEETTAEDATEVAIVSTKKSVVASIEELPSTQSEQQWIPCSERLPDKFGKYLAMVGPPWIIPRFRWIDIVFFIDGSWYYPQQEGVKIFAWMPLPKYEDTDND